jgi:hypothetical protein
MTYKHIIPYCAVPTAKKQLRYLNQYPWRYLISPFRPRIKFVDRCPGYAIDNGAWVFFNKQLEYDATLFLKDVYQYGDNADFVVIPDVVQNARKTLEISDYWIRQLSKYRLLFVAQDGISVQELEEFTKSNIGIFIGGSTEWKLSMIRPIADLCSRYDVLCHVGRVNTAKRLNLCVNGGAHSFDGSGMARFEETARIMTSEMIKLDNGLFKKDYANIKIKYGIEL